jgi:hypothetical protein
LNSVNEAVNCRLFMPFAAEAVHTNKEHVVYYRIYVKNYTIYYTVIDDVMEIRRFVYSRRNIKDIL